MRSLWRGRRADIAACGILVLVSGLLYLHSIGTTGWGNSFYSASAQAGASNWTAFLYASSDPGNLITVDKPPASIWLMALSVRAFGLTPAAVLLPEALLGIGTTVVVYATVRRVSSPTAGVFAGLIAAVTPAATLIFRYNNPDALLTFALAVAAFGVVSGLRSGLYRWFALAGAAFGAAFLTKQLQGLIALPIVALVVLWAGKGSWRRRWTSLAVGAGALIASAGWWVLLVVLVPSGSRPWIGGSKDDSFVSLTLGYNGLGRVLGGSGNAGSASGTGIDRLLVGATGTLIGWLLPAAIGLALGVGIIRRRSYRRPDVQLAALALFTGITLLTAAGLSFMRGIYHSYYAVALVPNLACGLALAAAMLWAERDRLGPRIVLAAAISGSTCWAATLLTRTSERFTVLAAIVAVVGTMAAIVIVVESRNARRIVALGVSAILLLVGPAAASSVISSVGHAGSGVSAIAAPNSDSSITYGMDPTLLSMLRADAGQFRWAAATGQGSSTAAKYQLSSGTSVMPIGGYKRSDPTPTLAQFQDYVDRGEVHWFIGGGGGDIGAWVQTHYVGQRIGGVLLYDLTVLPSAQLPRAAGV